MADFRIITIRVRIAWWVKPYILAMMVFAWLHGLEPNTEKIARFIAKRGLILKVSHG